MTQTASRNVFTQPLPPLPQASQEGQKPKTDVDRAALIVSSLIFAAGLLYLTSIGFVNLTIEGKLTIGLSGLVFLLLGSLGLIINAGLFTTKYVTRITLLLLCIELSLITGALFTDAIPILGATALVSSILLSSYFFSGFRTELFVTRSILAGLTTVVAGVFSPFVQTNAPVFNFFWGGILAIVAITLFILIIRGQIAQLLRMKLFFIAIAISLVPLISLVVVVSSLQTAQLEEKNKNYINLAASQEAAKVNSFIETNLNNLINQSQLAVFANFLELPEDEREGSQQQQELVAAIATLSKSSEQSFLKSYGVIDAKGTIVYDSYSPVVGANEADETYFRYSFLLGQGYFSSVRFLLYPYDASEVIFSAPIASPSGDNIGVIRMRYNADVFKSLLQTQRIETGDQIYPILVDENGIRVVDNLRPDLRFSPISPFESYALATLRQDNRVPFSYRPNKSDYDPALVEAIRNFRTNPYFTADLNQEGNQVNEVGYVVRIRYVPWFLIYVQDQTFASQQLRQQVNILVLVVSAFVALAGFFALAIARVLSEPILRLTSAAAEITKGNLNVKAAVKTSDEIGVLANVFNSMTERLRTIINELEERVADRTRELAEQNKSLAYRSQQLTTIADVARSIVAEQDLELLLSQVTSLISERFNFYHVGIFLIDPAGQYAVLRAANSEGGKRMLARQHKLRVGQVGIVGFATGTGQARIATDVGEDSIYFNNPDLPHTRSEMALPLKAGEQVIGALDVQSTSPNAFLNEDIELFSALSDQVAIAIVNSRLFEETQETLREMQDVHRQYLQQTWSTEVEDRQQIGYRYTLLGTTSEDLLPADEIISALESGEQNAQKQNNTLRLPIKLRGEPIGVIHIQGVDEPGTWNPAQIAAIEKLSDQIALALENARLFEETAKRANRDRKVLEITSKIRSTTDFNEMLQIAITELKQELNASGAQVVLQQANPNSNGHESSEGF